MFTNLIPSFNQLDQIKDIRLITIKEITIQNPFYYYSITVLTFISNNIRIAKKQFYNNNHSSLYVYSESPHVYVFTNHYIQNYTIIR